MIWYVSLLKRYNLCFLKLSEINRNLQEEVSNLQQSLDATQQQRDSQIKVSCWFFIDAWTKLLVCILRPSNGWLDLPYCSKFVEHATDQHLQLCSVLLPLSSSSCTCITLSTYPSPYLFSRCFLVVLFLCVHVAFTGVLVGLCCDCSFLWQ